MAILLKNFKDIVIFGTGAIGAVLATFLQISNMDNMKNIHLVGRKHILDVIKKKGLIYQPFKSQNDLNDSNNLSEDLSELIKRIKTIKTDGYKYYTDIKDVPQADIIFFSLKAHGLEKALKNAKHLLENPEKTPYIFLTMNGLGLVDVVSRFVSRDRIIECTVNYPSHLIGNIVKNSGGNSNILVEDTQNPPIREIIEQLFKPNTLDIRVIKEFKLAQWKKGIMNIGMNALSAITMSTVGQVLEKKTLGRIIKRLISESLLIAREEGIEIDGDMVEYFWRFAGRDPDHITSTYQDILNDKLTEVGFFNGYISKKGKEYNIPTPANDAIYTLIQIIEKH